MTNPKRFYKSATAQCFERGYTIALDGRTLKTPARAPLVLPTRALAEAAAAEWEAQQDVIDARAMPLTGFANAVIDHVAPRQNEVAAEALAYVDTDLLIYWNVETPALAARQQAIWGPLVDWAEETFGARLTVTRALTAGRQRPEAAAAFSRALWPLDPFRLLAVHGLTMRTGSLVLALAVLLGRLTPGQAHEAARLEEAFQNEKWGTDAEAEARAARLEREINDIGRFLALL